MRTAKQWVDYCEQHIVAGYVPGGSKGATYTSGCGVAHALRKLGAWKPGDRIVDVGSGNGRLAMGLLGEPVKYIGLEIVRPCVEFCREAFRDYANFAFHHIDVRSERYWSLGTIAPEKVSYPIADRWASAVIAESLFSHTGTLGVAQRNLSEMWRILQPGGRLFATWYLCPPRPALDTSEALTVYLRKDVLTMLDGWEIVTMTKVPGREKQTGILAVKRG